MLTKKVPFMLAALVLAAPLSAQDVGRTEHVQFARGTTSKAIKGRVKGYTGADYVVSARAGQKMTVTLKTSNASSYFNVTAPGAEAAMFVGSTSGNSFTTTIPSTGDYRIN